MKFSYLNLRVIKLLIPEITGIKMPTLKNYRSLVCSDEQGNILVELYKGRQEDFRNIEGVGDFVELTIEPDVSGVQSRLLCSEVDNNKITFIRPNATCNVTTKFSLNARPYELENCGFKFIVGKYYLIKLKKVEGKNYPEVDEEDDFY